MSACRETSTQQSIAPNQVDAIFRHSRDEELPVSNSYQSIACHVFAKLGDLFLPHSSAQSHSNAMSSNDNQTPDLASVLSILASLTPQTQNFTTQGPSAASFPAQNQPQEQWQQTVQPTPPPRSTTPTDPPPNTVKLVDPATIIEWSSGLRCVMKTVAKHETILLEIRRVCFLFLVRKERG